MGDHEKIRIRCKRTVVSCRETTELLGKNFQPSPLDHTMLHTTLHLLFYYHNNKFSSPTKPPLGSITIALRESLARLLSSYPVVTGRLQRLEEGQREWKVKLNDAGMRMVEAVAEGTVKQWLQKVDRERERSLLYWEDIPTADPIFWSPFYVQVTEFEGGGLAIGISCTHMLADATTLTSIFKEWAEINQLTDITKPPNHLNTSLPQPLLLDENHGNRTICTSKLIQHYSSAKSSSSSATDRVQVHKLATITFQFTENMVQSCMEATNVEAAPFTALAAMFWHCISQVKGRKEQLMDMSICLDMRKTLQKLHQDKDNNFVGNAMVFGVVEQQAEPMESTTNQLTRAAKAIDDHMTNMMSNKAMLVDLLQWLDLEAKSYGGDYTRCHDNRLVCANLEHISPYGVVFEKEGSVIGGAPLRVSCFVEPVGGGGYVVILPSTNEDGRMAMVTLPQQEAAKLSRHPLLLRFATTIHPNLITS